jgi:cytochrome P450
MVAHSKRAEPVMCLQSQMVAQPIEQAFNAFEAPPEPAYYDNSLNGWVLSQYADVVAALHDERLCPVSSRTEHVPAREEMTAQRELRIQTLTACSGQQIKAWQLSFKELARQMITKLRSNTRADIIRNFAEPWALQIALMVTRADEKDRTRLSTLARVVSMASADPSNQALRESARSASDELAHRLESSPIPMSGPAFVAISQTLPRFLANAWLALLRNSLQLERLRQQPDLMPAAIEELLRYAGLAHTLFRRASSAINLAGVTIAQGDRVMLKLASANRDPAQFVKPECLDIARRNGPQLALGIGMHSCGGGLLIKTLAGIATVFFVENVSELDQSFPIEWWGGTGFRSPNGLHVLLRQDYCARPATTIL